MRQKRRLKKVGRGEFLEVFEEAYQEWKKWSSFYSHLPSEGFAMEGAYLRGRKRYEDEVKKAYGRFDNAIRILVTSNKTALGDPRVIERIKQAQWFGDTYFFDGLAGSLKNNVGFDRRLAKDPAVACIFECASRYLHGDKKCIREEYSHWKSMDLKMRRRKGPKDPKFQSIVDHWEKAKESIVSNGLENFRARVKRMAERLETGSMPIPAPSNKE